MSGTQPSGHNDAAGPPPPRPEPEPIAARFGLVRPRHGRHVAGVCAALGRATHTDPLLWRVMLPVLICFFGLGALVYVVVWLLAPAEDDTASPFEALLGRGHSHTHPALSGLLALAAVGLLALVLPQGLTALLGAALVLGVILLVNRVRTGQSPAAAGEPAAAGDPVAAGGAAPWTGPAVPGDPGTPAASEAAAASAAAAPRSAMGPAASPSPGPPAYASPSPGSLPGPPSSAGPPPPAVSPTLDPVPAGAGPLDMSGYRPPFAPHGPYAGPVPTPPTPPPPRPVRQRSVLTAATVLATLVVLGLLGVVDLVAAPMSVPLTGYLLAAFGVVGIGLLVGAWRGRARGLVAIGVVLVLALPLAAAVDTWDRPEHMFGDFTWIPSRVSTVEDEYELSFGSGQLDLSEVDLSGQEVEVAVRVTFGDVLVVVPADAAVLVTVDHEAGRAVVFGQEIEGDVIEIRDDGSGDPADGLLRLYLRVMFGSGSVVR